MHATTIFSTAAFLGTALASPLVVSRAGIAIVNFFDITKSAGHNLVTSLIEIDGGPKTIMSIIGSGVLSDGITNNITSVNLISGDAYCCITDGNNKEVGLLDSEHKSIEPSGDIPVDVIAWNITCSSVKSAQPATPETGEEAVFNFWNDELNMKAENRPVPIDGKNVTLNFLVGSFIGDGIHNPVSRGELVKGAAKCTIFDEIGKEVGKMDNVNMTKFDFGGKDVFAWKIGCEKN